MSTINFTRTPGTQLYFADDGSGTLSQTVAFLLVEGSTYTADTISLENSWLVQNNYQGFYLFLGQPVQDQTAFINLASNYLNNIALLYPPIFTWVPNPNNSSFTAFSIYLNTPPLLGQNQTLPFRTLGLVMEQNCPVTLDQTNSQFIIGNPNNSIYLSTPTVSPNLPVVGPNLYLPLSGDGAGCLQFQVTLREADLTQLDAGLRYYMPNPAKQLYLMSQRYPLFKLAAANSTISPMVSLDPNATLSAQGPLDATRNFFQFNGQAGTNGQTSTPAALDSYFSAHTGETVALTPQNNARLVFAANATQATAQDTDNLYLVPAGDFDITLAVSVARPQTTGGNGDSTAYRFMCGLFGTEYFGLSASEGNVLSFTPGQPAYAPNFQPTQSGSGNNGNGGGGVPLVASAATTSWAQIQPAGTGSDAAVYYAQPQSAPLFTNPAAPLYQAQRVSFSPTTGTTGEPAGGTFTLSYGGQTTGNLNYNAQASDIQAALQSLSGIGTGNVNCSGGALPDTPVVVQFGSAITQPTALSGSGSQLTGGSFNVAVSPYYLSFREIGLASVNGGAASTLAPLVPYSGIATSDSPAGVTPSIIQMYETQVLNLTRKDVITNHGESVKQAVMAVRESKLKGAAAPGDSSQNTVTPQGFVVELAGAGGTGATWNTMNLALTDSVPSSLSSGELTGDTGQTSFSITNLDEITQDAFQRNQICLVITSLDPTHFIFSTLEGALSFAGWQFNIAPPAPSKDASACDADKGDFSNCPTALIFKFFNNTSFFDLVGQPDNWTYGADFNTDTKSTSDYLTAYVKVAIDDVNSKGQDSLYYDFVTKGQDKNWNGIMALNVHIPPTALPEELQGLKAGLGNLSNLRAQYVGIEINDVKNMQLNKSSLFALIDYENPGPAPTPDNNGYSFFVPTLQIAFANSAISYFHCEVDAGLGSFFGEKSTQNGDGAKAAGDGDDSATIIKIFGTYQNHDGESVYSFVTETEYDFTFPNSTFLQSLTLNKVQFSTTSVENGGNSVKSTLSFWGSMAFNILGGSKSDGGSNPLDPFSFSQLSFADLSLSLSYVNAGGSSSTTFAFNPGDIRFDLGSSIARSSSFLSRLPLQLKSFMYSECANMTLDSMSYYSLGTLSFNLPEATNFQYALVFELDLGSMGALVSSLSAFKTNIIVGWIPDVTLDADFCGQGTTYTAGMVVGIQLPDIHGKLVIGVEGVLQLAIQNFILDYRQPSSGTQWLALIMQDCTLDILGTKIPPDGTQFSVYLFAPPDASVGSKLAQQIAWAVTVDREGGGGNGNGGNGGGGEESKQLKAAPAEDENGEGGGDNGGGDNSGGSILDLKYLGLGQRVGPDEGTITSFETALDWMEKDFTKAVTNNNFGDVYKPDHSWIVVAKLSLLDGVVTLGGVFYDPDVYSLLISLKGLFDFEITYSKISDTIGMYYINVGPPPELRQLQFGAVSVSIPNFAVSIYTNGDFKVDVGFPANLDFSKSFQIQSLPFTGAGGFYFAKLSAATSNVFPAPSYHTILEFGIGIQLGLGKDFNQGILSAGLSITFYGILEGALGYGPANLPSSGIDLTKPDALSVKGQFGIIGKIYGTINFGIIQATVSVDLQAGVGIQMLIPDQNYLELWIQASVSLSVSIRINLLFFHITISFSFSASIRFDWQIPYGSSSSSSSKAVMFSFGSMQALPVVRLKPLTWLPSYSHTALLASKGGLTAAPALDIFFMPELTMVYPALNQPGVPYCIASLIIECPDPGGITGDGSKLTGGSGDQFTILVASSAQGQQISISPGSATGKAPTGGTFTLSYGSQTTTPLNYNAQAAAVQTALANLSSIGSGRVNCTGGALPATPIDAQFNFPFTNLLTAFAGWLMQSALQSETNPAQRIVMSTGALTKAQPTGGTFTLTYENETTAPIPFDAEADDVSSALQGLYNIGSGNVICTGGPLPTFPIDVDLVGDITNPGTITANAAGLYASTGDKFSVSVSQPSQTSQQVSLSTGSVTSQPPTGGTFTLTYGGQTTALLSYDAQSADVQSALQNLTAIGAGNVTCTGGPLPATPITVQFGTNIPQPTAITGDGSQLVRSDTFSINIEQVTNTILDYQSQQVSIQGTPPANSTFTLTYNNQTTAPIPATAQASDIQTALEKIVGAGQVFCYGGALPGTSVVVRFVENGTAAQALTASATGFTVQTSPMVSREQLKLLGFVLHLTPTLARPMNGVKAADASGLLDYTSLVSFLTANFTVTVEQAPNHSSTSENDATPFAATFFPMIPDLELKTQGRVQNSQPSEYSCQFWNQTMCDTNYQNFLDTFFEKQFINVSGSGTNMLAAEEDDASVSMATVVFQDYFDMMAKQLVDTMYQQVTNSGAPYGMTMSDLLAYVTSLNEVVNMAGMAAKVFRSGLRIPESDTAGAQLDGMFDLVGQQFAAYAPASGQASYNVMLDNTGAPNQWVTLNNATVAIPESVLATMTPVELTPTFPGSVQKLDYLNSTPKTFAFQTFIPWSQVGGATSVLAPFSTDLLNSLVANPTGISVQLKDTETSQPINTDDPVIPTSQYNWATRVQLTVTQVPKTTSSNGGGNTTSFIPNVYQIGGADAANEQYIEALLNYFQQQGGTGNFSMYLLYQQSAGVTGLNSVNLVPGGNTPSSTFIIRTNMSTDALPPPSKMAKAFGAEDTAPCDNTDLLVDASFDQTKQFLEIIQDCSVTNMSGYYLYYADPSSGDGLPSALFTGDNQPAPITLLLVNTGNTGDPQNSQILPFYNTLVFSSSVQPAPGQSDKLYYAEAASIQSWSVAVAPGCLGFSIDRNNPNPPDGSQPSTEQGLESLYNSLGWSINAAGDFCASGESLPVGPVPVWPGPQNTVEPPIWRYAQFVPVYKYAKENNDNNCNSNSGYLSRYAGINQQVTLDFQLLDVFGNVLEMPSNVQSESFTNLYFDSLIPFSQWLGVKLTYDFQVQGNNPATANAVQINVTLDPTVLPTSDQADKLAQLIETYQLIQDQITAPATTFYIESTLDPQATTHDLATSDAQNIVTFVGSVITYLTQVEQGGSPTLPTMPPIVYTFAADTNSTLPEIFEVTVTLGIHRNQYIDPSVSLVDNPATADVSTVITSSVNADSANLNNYLQNLQQFAARFNQAFSELVLSTAGQGTSSSLWAVKQRVVQIQISAPYTDTTAQTNRSVYFSPKPLYNSLQSETVLVPDYSNLSNPPAPPTIQRTFVDVDADVYCRQFFSAFESMMAPDMAAAARRIMEANQTLSTFDQMVQAKAKLACAYSNEQIYWLFAAQQQSTPAQGSEAIAIDEFGQQLRTTLASAYLVDTVVQYPVTWTTPPPSSLSGNVNLFGRVAPPTGNNEAGANYTLSTSKVAVNPSDGPFTFGAGSNVITAPGMLSFLFGATSEQAMEAAASVAMNLVYQITHVEYRASADDDWSWLQLVQTDNLTNVFNVAIGSAGTSVEIPIPLRQYPTPPTLINQSGGSPFTTDPTTLAQARLWQYVYSYQVQEIAQDVIHTSVTYNTGAGGGTASTAKMFAAEDDPPVSLFEALCRFYYAYPSLQPTLATLSSVTDPTKATAEQLNAILAFCKLVNWMATNTDWFKTFGEKMFAEDGSMSYVTNYAITDVETAGNPAQRTLTMCPASDNPPQSPPIANVNILPLLLINNTYQPPPGVTDTLVGSCQEVTYNLPQGQETAGSMVRRQISITGLDIMNTENALAAVQIYRNEALFTDDGEADIWTTYGDFIYKTPAVLFNAETTPLIDNSALVDIADLNNTGKDEMLPLATQLDNLFTTLFTGAVTDQTSSRRLTVGCSYGYDISPALGTEILAVVPVILIPPQELGTDAADLSTFSNNLASAIIAWANSSGLPTTKGSYLSEVSATFLFDITIFAALSGTNLPILRLRNLSLSLQYVTEFNQ
jgi:hypothetical protein